jgi:hypothetical protein
MKRLGALENLTRVGESRAAVAPPWLRHGRRLHPRAPASTRTLLRWRRKRESSQVLEVVSRIGQLFHQDRRFIPQDSLVSRKGDLWISLLGSRVVEEGKLYSMAKGVGDRLRERYSESSATECRL